MPVDWLGCGPRAQIFLKVFCQSRSPDRDLSAGILRRRFRTSPNSRRMAAMPESLAPYRTRNTTSNRAKRRRRRPQIDHADVLRAQISGEHRTLGPPSFLTGVCIRATRGVDASWAPSCASSSSVTRSISDALTTNLPVCTADRLAQPRLEFGPFLHVVLLVCGRVLIFSKFRFSPWPWRETARRFC